MPTLEKAPIEIQAQSLSGRFITHAEKKLNGEQVYRGQNWRQNKDGGRYPRPGYRDSEMDYTVFSPTLGRGMLSGKLSKRLWVAVDNGSNVKITYVDTNINNAQYAQIFDVGLTLTTGKYVYMMEWQGNVFYANGADTVGEILVAEVASGGVLSGAITLDLKGGRGVFFAATGSGQIGEDTFTWSGKTNDQLTGVSGIASDHLGGEIVTCNLTVSPTYQDKASIVAEWVSSLNLFGDPEQPFVWEFSKFATAGSPGNFTDFSATPSNTELVGEGGVITGALKTKDFFYVFKEDSLYATARVSIDEDTGARIPQPIEGASGNANPRTVTKAGKGGNGYYITGDGHFIELGPQVESGQITVGLNNSFDDDLKGVFSSFNRPDEKSWLTYNTNENFLKFSVFEDDVRVVYVWDFDVKTFYRDTNKNYDCVVEHMGNTWAFDGSAQKLYIDEVGNFDDDVPVNCEWETGRLGRDEFQNGKAIYYRMHGYMTQGSINYVDFYKDGKFQFTKILDDSYITTLEDDGVRIGHGSIGSGGFVSASIAGGGPIVYPFRFPVGANHMGEDYKLKVRSDGERGDFVQFDGFSIGIRPLKRNPYKHA